MEYYFVEIAVLQSFPLIQPATGVNIYLNTHLETASTNLLHYHETAHLSFVLNGGVIDKRKLKETERTSGELMFFHAGEPQESNYKSFPVKSINIELEPEFFRKNEINEMRISPSFADNPNTKFSLLKIYKELMTNDNLLDCSIEILLIGLVDDKNLDEKLLPNWINKIVELLRDNWNNVISLEDLAVAANVHPKTISKHFPKYFNCTLSEYRRKVKIEKSLSLIKSSKKSLTEISYECGFYDQSHFTATFKELTGFRKKDFQKI